MATGAKFQAAYNLMVNGLNPEWTWKDKEQYCSEVFSENFERICIDGTYGNRYTCYEDNFDIIVEIFKHDIFKCDFVNVTLRRVDC